MSTRRDEALRTAKSVIGSICECGEFDSAHMTLNNLRFGACEATSCPVFRPVKFVVKRTAKRR